MYKFKEELDKYFIDIKVANHKKVQLQFNRY